MVCKVSLVVEQIGSLKVLVRELWHTLSFVSPFAVWVWVTKQKTDEEVRKVTRRYLRVPGALSRDGKKGLRTSEVRMVCMYIHTYVCTFSILLPPIPEKKTTST